MQPILIVPCEIRKKDAIHTSVKQSEYSPQYQQRKYAQKQERKMASPSNKIRNSPSNARNGTDIEKVIETCVKFPFSSSQQAEKVLCVKTFFKKDVKPI